jgi:PAS domain S-box-containing protein
MTDSDAGDERAPDGPGKGTPRSPMAQHDAAQFASRSGTSDTLGQSPGLYRLLVESVSDYAIFALDPDGFIMSWNAGAERIKGYRADEVIGRHLSIFYRPDDLAWDKPGEELRIAAREGRVADEGWRIRKDGTQFWANVVITALFADDGTLIGFAKVTRDLTERREAQQREVEDARRLAEADAANRAKTGFLAAMSHELRTPLNAIAGYAQLMQEGIGGPVSEQQSEYLSRIRASQQHLLGIVNDLLNYSRVEAGEVAYERTAVSVCDVVDRVIAMVTPQATRKGLWVEHGPCASDVVALVDELKTEQVLLNLVSNAVKFTPEGGTISVGCGRRGADATIEVRDTGPGIPGDMLDAIFDPFVQLGRTLTSAHEGAGLGLAISRDLARAMGGDVNVESTVGVGSTFTVRLPAA